MLCGTFCTQLGVLIDTVGAEAVMYSETCS